MVNGDDFIQSAICLKSKSPLSEMDFRNIVSRSYYGAYHYCCILVQSYSIKLNGGSTHQKLADGLKAHTNKDIRKIGNQLAQCHKYRITADYHIDRCCSEREMGVQLKKTQQIIKSVVQMIEK